MSQLMGWGMAIGGAFLSLVLGIMTPAIAEEIEEGLTQFDLSELAEGETRTFGESDHAMTATREGDVVIVTLPGKGGEPRIMKCTVGKGSCYAYTTGDGSGTKMVFLQKGDGGEVSKNVEVIVTGDHEAGDFSWVSAGGTGDNCILGEGVQVVRLGEGKLVLRCPEGDTTMRLDKDEAVGTYYCPQHNLALEEAKIERGFRKLLIKKMADE